MQKFIEDLRKSASAVFLATEEDVAHDLSEKLNKAAKLIDELDKICERLIIERDSERLRCDKVVELLGGIHALLYPPPFKTADGKTMVFRPKGQDASHVLQCLSDRIHSLPEEIQKLNAREA